MGADTATVRPVDAGKAPAKGQAKGGAASPAGSSALRIFKFFAGLALIPACVGFTLGLQAHFLGVWTRVGMALNGPEVSLKWFCLGAVAFAFGAVLLWRPVIIYVFGHELVHALATWLCLGRVSNLTASTSGGRVTTSKSNTFIRLAPYCVPLYALLAAAVFCGLNAWWRPLGPYLHWLAFALGFFYAFHVGFSLWSLRRDQPDLKADGWLFSLVLIYLMNLLVFVLLMEFVLQGNVRELPQSSKDYLLQAWQQTEHIYRNLSTLASQAINR
jgi:hypothetical protein